MAHTYICKHIIDIHVLLEKRESRNNVQNSSTKLAFWLVIKYSLISEETVPTYTQACLAAHPILLYLCNSSTHLIFSFRQKLCPIVEGWSAWVSSTAWDGRSTRQLKPFLGILHLSEWQKWLQGESVDPAYAMMFKNPQRRCPKYVDHLYTSLYPNYEKKHCFFGDSPLIVRQDETSFPPQPEH